MQQVRELMSKINSLEEQRDALERQVAARQQPAAANQVAPPGSAAPYLPLLDQLLFKVTTQLCYLCCRTLLFLKSRSCNACLSAAVSVVWTCMTSTSTYAGCVACLSVQTGVPVQESELVEARLERSQAQAKAQRAQQRLDEFLAQQPAPQVCLQPV